MVQFELRLTRKLKSPRSENLKVCHAERARQQFGSISTVLNVKYKGHKRLKLQQALRRVTREEFLTLSGGEGHKWSKL